jgi:hypothetical protein
MLILLLSCFVMMADAEATPKTRAFTQAELDTIGTTFAQAINNQDLDTLNEIFDLNAFTHRKYKPRKSEKMTAPSLQRSIPAFFILRKLQM